MTLTRTEREGLQSAIRVANRHGLVADGPCVVLLALVERETAPADRSPGFDAAPAEPVCPADLLAVPHPHDAKCRQCGNRLLFSARQRGDGLCSPCNRDVQRDEPLWGDDAAESWMAERREVEREAIAAAERGHEQECASWIPGGDCTCPVSFGGALVTGELIGERAADANSSLRLDIPAFLYGRCATCREPLWYPIAAAAEGVCAACRRAAEFKSPVP